jgi:hypothetical protein
VACHDEPFGAGLLRISGARNGLPGRSSKRAGGSGFVSLADARSASPRQASFSKYASNEAWRRERDSNPRSAFGGHAISSRAD